MSSTDPDRRRSAGISRLARDLLEARHDLDKIVAALASSLAAIVPGALVVGTLEDGTISVTRDHDALDDADLSAIATCIEYTAIAADTARGVRTERERTSQFQEEMVGIVGHDLQGPLGAIVTSTELLATDRTNDAAPVVARIASFARRMTRMVDQLLDLTRARLGGGIPLFRRTTRLVPLLETVVDAARVRHPNQRFDLGGATDVTGIWDPDRISQVMSYLLSNGAHYGLEGAPITVAVEEGVGIACITVHNELRGVPIPPDLLRRLFEPRRREGVGLDLYLVNAIVVAHGGTTTVESSQAGTTFLLVLPAARGVIP